MTTVIALIDSVENVDELIKKISLADVVEYVKEVWNSMDGNTVKKCFNKSGINCVLSEVEDTNVESVDQIENELVELGQQIGIDIDMRFNEDEEFEDEDDWEKVIVETHANASTSKEVEETQMEEEGEEIPAVPLNEALNYVNRLKQLGRNLGNNKMVDLLHEVQTILEKEVIDQNRKSSRQTSLHEYFNKQ